MVSTDAVAIPTLFKFMPTCNRCNAVSHKDWISKCPAGCDMPFYKRWFNKFNTWYLTDSIHDTFIVAHDSLMATIKVLIQERDLAQAEVQNLKEKSKIDGEIYNLGRSEGQCDTATQIRKIVDPEDKNQWNLNGVIKEVQRLTEQPYQNIKTQELNLWSDPGWDEVKATTKKINKMCTATYKDAECAFAISNHPPYHEYRTTTGRVVDCWFDDTDGASYKDKP